MIGEMAVTAAKALISKIQDEQNPWRSICKVLGEDSVGIIDPMLTMGLFYSKWNSIIPLKDIFAQCQARFNIMVKQD